VDHLAAALAYALAGVYVFPLAPRSKVPLIPARNGGHGLHDATTDLDVIRSWWQAHPTANLGLRTDLSFDVIDLDSEDAVAALEEARAGREPPQGPVVRTGHGFHWYVKSMEWGIVPAFCRGSISGAEGAMYSDRLLSIQRVIATAGSTRCERNSHPRRIGSFSSSSQNAVQPDQEPCQRGPEPMDMERCAENFSGSPRQCKALATTNSIPLHSIWAG
jgi:hypothetical protein